MGKKILIRRNPGNKGLVRQLDTYIKHSMPKSSVKTAKKDHSTGSKYFMGRSAKQRKVAKAGRALLRYTPPPEVAILLEKDRALYTTELTDAAMINAYLRVKKKKHLLFIDIDGTCIEHNNSQDPYRLRVRPYTAVLKKRLAPFYDIVLFTRADYDRARQVHAMHFRDVCSLFFWETHCEGLKKRIEIFNGYCSILKIIDDNPIHMTDEGMKYWIPISKWQGNLNDKEFKSITADLEHQARTFSENAGGSSRVDLLMDFDREAKPMKKKKKPRDDVHQVFTMRNITE